MMHRALVTNQSEQLLDLSGLKIDLRFTVFAPEHTRGGSNTEAVVEA